MTEPTTADTHRVWLKVQGDDGASRWGWQVLRNGRVIAFGEARNEGDAQRAAASATQNYAKPLKDSM